MGNIYNKNFFLDTEPTLNSGRSCEYNDNDSTKITLQPETPKTNSTDWSKYNSTKLKKPKSSELRLPKSEGKNIQQKISTWALSKTELVELQKKCFLEEHQLKLRHMQEKHELFMDIQKKEWEIKKKIMLKDE